MEGVSVEGPWREGQRADRDGGGAEPSRNDGGAAEVFHFCVAGKKKRKERK